MSLLNKSLLTGGVVGDGKESLFLSGVDSHWGTFLILQFLYRLEFISSLVCLLQTCPHPWSLRHAFSYPCQVPLNSFSERGERVWRKAKCPELAVITQEQYVRAVCAIRKHVISHLQRQW